MHRLDIAILRTIIYGDVFHFPMTLQEIHHYLIYDQVVTIEQVRARLNSSSLLTQYLSDDGLYYALRFRDELFSLRSNREQMMPRLSKQMVKFGRLLTYMPFVEMVCVTGALAMRNPSSEHDDLDYLIVTYPGRVWLTRAIIILLVRFMRIWRVEICPNYVLASDQLAQARRDLYIAHEIVQMIPLSNAMLYNQMRQANQWTVDYLPNASEPFYPLLAKRQNRWGLSLKKRLEQLLSSPLGDWLEQWEFNRKVQRFQRDAALPEASAEIDEGHVKGHFQDYGNYVLERYHQRLHELQLNNDLLETLSAGD